MKGQVTIYTLKGCAFCLRAKQTLRDRGLPIVEHSVDDYSGNLTQWLKKTTGKTSVPQIFFNEVLVGGNDELEAATKDESKWTELSNILEKPVDISYFPMPQLVEDKDIEFACVPDHQAIIIEQFVNSGVMRSIRPRLFSGKFEDAFSGASFLQWYCKAKNSSLEQGLKEGTDLLNKKFFLLLDPNGSKQLENDSKIFYRLNRSSGNTALNAGPMQFCKIENDTEFSELIRKLVLQLYDNFISPDGKFVDYGEMKLSSSFIDYVKLSKELQRMTVESMSDDERKAFFINIYNALVIHGTAVAGSPTGWYSRLRFYDTTKYIIGGYLYSLNDIENGILRGNKRGALTLCTPFGKSDPRLSASLTQIDPRIHFALNCGAKSCPPIKTFRAQSIDEDLAVATEAYLETDEGIIILIDEEKKTTQIQLSSLFKWYHSDFGETDVNVIEWIIKHLGDEEKKKKLQTVFDKASFKISYLSYDWGTNAKE